MDLCLIKVFLPLTEEQNIQQLLSSYPGLETESIFKSQQQLLVNILLKKERVETVVDDLKQKFPNLEDCQLLVLPAETRPSQTNVKLPKFSETDKDDRVDQQEVYTQISQGIRLDTTEISLVILSTVIAAIGLVQGSEVVIIGAMVIAPLLKPNMALAVATTFGDLSLAIKTIKVGLTEIVISLLLSILLGILVPVNLGMNEIAIRTSVNLSDVVLAFASGVAGAISLTVDEQKAVVGVMVSVALLPPLVVLGMLIGSQLWQPAIETAVLVSTNIVCLNLAAIATFWLRDVRPQQWWQKFQASKITGIATTFWLVILAILISVIFMFQINQA
ncbi:TIGR00341 family protein [Pleurocapsa sp. PCC 7319]|uniref:TIGR00341 family protein n=1 Tax=Pleurocapsa sp. PCC 7319 TaxID=118161 RepID=UPI0003462243|nr:TIGR00341 family protein [Pleurocapsa sp. PCC 7319]